jgi:hypothetical protein
MRYKEIDINIKAIPDKEDEALLNQLMGAKGVSVSDTDSKADDTGEPNSDNPGKVASDDPNTVPTVYPLQQELELKKQEPETTDGDQPGVPKEMKNKEPKTESEFIQRLKTLSGQN